ncbi:TPA: transcriptional regulator, partial [Pasteurella multocida]|nr:transcriptional regulator [Pasteurella multocida]
MSTNADIFDEKAPEILADLAKHIETQLLTKVKSNEFNSELAKQIGIEVASHIAQSWGGEV